MKKIFLLLLISVILTMLFPTITIIDVKDYVQGKVPFIFQLYQSFLKGLDQYQRDFICILISLTEIEQHCYAKGVSSDGFPSALLNIEKSEILWSKEVEKYEITNENNEGKLITYLPSPENNGKSLTLEMSWGSKSIKDSLIGMQATNIREDENKIKADVVLWNSTQTWVYVEQEFTPQKIGQIPVSTQEVHLLGPSSTKNLGTIEFFKDSFLQFKGKTAIGVSLGTPESNMLLGALAIDLLMRGLFNEELPPNAFSFDHDPELPLDLGMATIDQLFYTITSRCSGPLGVFGRAVVMKDTDSAITALGKFLACTIKDQNKEIIQEILIKLFSIEVAKKWASEIAESVGDFINLPMRVILMKILTENTFKAQPESWVRIDAAEIEKYSDEQPEGRGLVLSSPLTLIPDPPYYQGAEIQAEFSLLNRDDQPVTLSVLTVGGRDPDEYLSDFTHQQNITIEPSRSHPYQGTLQLTKTGAYHFFCTYQTPDGQWNTNVDLGEGFTDQDRVKDIVVREREEEPPEGKADLVIMDFYIEPNQPLAGGNYSIGVCIENQGDKSIEENFQVMVYLNDEYIEQFNIDGLGIGHTSRILTTSYFEWPLDTNSHTISAIVDPNNIINESDESNNQYSISVISLSIMPASVILEEFSGTTIGNSYGIDYTDTPNGQGAVFSSVNESRIEYPFSMGFPREGTIEYLIKVNQGYNYSNYVVKDNACARIFDTGGQDVWYPGAMWLNVCENGNINVYTATAYAREKGHNLEANGTNFAFNEWHAIGFSFGSQGQYIMLNGDIVTSNASYTESLQTCGNFTAPIDIPTVGELLSCCWNNNRYGMSFEGIIDTFRVSEKQKDWYLSR